MKKIELHSKEKWIGMDISSNETGLVVCSLIDSKAAKMRGVNTEVYTLGLVFTLYDYKNPSFGVLGWQEFFDNRFDSANIMRRHSNCDIFLVGSIGSVGIFHMEVSPKFNLLSVVSGFGEYPLSDIYFEEKILLLVRQHPKLDYPIVYYDLRQDQGNLSGIDEDEMDEKDEKETQLEELSMIFLQPNIKYHPVQKFKDEVMNYHTILECVGSKKEDLVTIGNQAGVSHMIKREGNNLYEAAISSTGFNLLNLRVLQSGQALIQLQEDLSLVVLDKSAKQALKFNNDVTVPENLKISSIF